MKSTGTFSRLLLSCAITAMLLLASAGCTTTRTENGVQIEQKRSYNPLKYIPW